MRGPSSSHTAASWRLGKIARHLIPGKPKRAITTFDKAGSYSRVFRQQRSDKAFVAGLLGWGIDDDRFHTALDHAPLEGLDAEFLVGTIQGDKHPNAVTLLIQDVNGAELTVNARSIGGGKINITKIDGMEVLFNGEQHELLVSFPSDYKREIVGLISQFAPQAESSYHQTGEIRYCCVTSEYSLDGLISALAENTADVSVYRILAIMRPKPGKPLFTDAETMLEQAREKNLSLGKLAIQYESKLLNISEREVRAELKRRYNIMTKSIRNGLEDENIRLRLMNPVAGSIMKAERDGKTAVGGLHTRTSAKAMAVMHCCAGSGVVCAAPTGGSAGVIPAVLDSLEKEFEIFEGSIIEALAAAGAIGLIILCRGTFAAEEAGCQVEIGAAGAMAAAAVVDAADGSTAQCADAAAISLQNTMGLICDLVQGTVEIPCHTRNAVAASSAFVCADLILGGYQNPVNLDDSVDASIEVGRSLNPEFRCTSRGGVATKPSALAIKPKTDL